MKEQILSCLGRFPSKAPLKLQRGEKREKDGYTIEKISYQTEPNERVNSLLLCPQKLRVPAPAVLAIHQHAAQWHMGKSEPAGLAGDPMYHYGADLAKRGYVVLCPDLLCFEERIPAVFNHSDEERKTYERFEFCRRLSLGSCLQTKYLHDLQVSLDVLQALQAAPDCSAEAAPLVDADRIGVIGHSLGGQQAIMLTFYDERVKACVSSCGVSTLSSVYAHHIIHNFALYIPGLLTVCDMDEIVAQIAPRPLLLLSGREDTENFPLDGVRQIEQRAAQVYQEQGAAHHFVSAICEGGHAFTHQEQAYDFFDRFL